MDWERLIPEGFAAFSSFDANALAVICDEDVAIRPMRAAFEDTVYRGREGVERFIRESRETWAELTVEAERIEPDGDRALVLGTLRGRSVSGLPIDAEVAWIAQGLDGKLLKIKTYVDRNEALQDFAG